MIETSGEALQFEDLRALLARYVQGPLGRRALERLEPRDRRDAIEATLACSAEALDYWAGEAKPGAPGRAPVRISLGALPDPAEALALLRIEGASLEGGQFRELTSLLAEAGAAREILLDAAERFPQLARIAGAMVDLRDVVRDIEAMILPDGSLADDASPMLARLRRDIARQRTLVAAALERFLREHRGDGTLREDLVTIRNDRFVVPVVAGQQRKADGVIHGASGSGHTLFVEPLDTIGLNNEMVRLREEEMREQRRILLELTARLRPQSEAISRTADAIGRLDLLFAIASFGAAFDCAIPSLSPPDAPALELDRARHPLLEDVLRGSPKRVVPVSLRLDARARTLLISGPNTGGKTVAMKTAGLLALMAHAGLPVPARRAVFPCLDRVLADVGDHQSIEESLSSFSAHVAHVGRMLEEASDRSLVLLDELGRATDPEEAGALGTAILEEFHERGAFTIASTHLLALKVYGATTPGVVNASMGFDEETLEPTYVLKLGVPGRSAALSIASRLGLPERLIERARAKMTSQERDIAQFLDELRRRAGEFRAAEARLAEQAREMEERAKRLETEAAKRERAKLRELEEKSAAALAAFDERSREAIERIAALAESKKAAAQAERIAAKAKREFHEAALPAAQASAGVVEGARVRLRGVREPATVLRLLGGGRLEVQAGWMKMQVQSVDVEEVLPASAAPPGLKNITFRPEGPNWDVSYREINVIGQKAEEAVANVDKFLDSAAMASVDRVRIVHGHGMGVLKRAVAELLASNVHVAKFYAATPAEGGTGATVAELK